MPIDISDAVAESGDYELVYQVAIPATNEWEGENIPYSIDNTATSFDFDRIAYVLELDGEWVWASFDTFTTELVEIGVPTDEIHPVAAQRYVRNLNVFSSIVDPVRLKTGNAIADGNIEFWYGNTGTTNAHGIPGASSGLYDTGDTMRAGGYGSMQLHNPVDNQVVFAFGNWGYSNGDDPHDLGIGSQPLVSGGQPDWTFAENGGEFTIRNLYILARPGTPGDLTVEAPRVKRAVPSLDRNFIYVEFDQEMSPTAADPANYSIEGLTINWAGLAHHERGAYLAVSSMQEATAYTLKVSSSVSEKGPGIQGVADQTMVNFETFATPDVFAEIPELELFTLAAHLEIPESAFFASSGVPYAIEEALFNSREFGRVGYALVLRSESDTEWVFASFDAHTNDLARVGIPTAAVGTWQHKVQRLNVSTNIEDRTRITPGIEFQGGNIEFWHDRYGDKNQINIPNASHDVYDTGDKIRPIGIWGSFQVHNHLLNEVLFAYNGWADSHNPNDLGIGTNLLEPNPDWTLERNAGDYVARDLYIFVSPSLPPMEITDFSPTPAGDGAVLTWNSIPGVEYAIEKSEDLENWDEITDNKMSDGVISTYTVDLEENELFFRVRPSG